MDPTNDGPYQPTAFSELEYRFSIPDSVPRRDTDDHPSSFRALTAVGHYDSGQGDLVLWRERTVVEFPPGSTFLFPAGLVHYSFSAVEKPGRQMLISQSCSAGLHGYVENGFDDRFRSVGKTSSSMERRHIAKGAIELYSKIAEYDAAAETYAK
jgi:hypothetical protein